MAIRPRGIDDLERVGGVLCIDFVNTIGWRGTSAPSEWLTTYGDLVQWSRGSEILTDADTAHLLVYLEQRPEDAKQVLEIARALRESLYQVFSALARDRTPTGADVAALNQLFPNTMEKLQLAVADGGFQWQWRREPDALDGMIHPIIHSAAELLTSPRIARLKECASRDGCAWLFLDTSRNGSRRWCDMRECGNRVKARRHYQRVKQRDITS